MSTRSLSARVLHLVSANKGITPWYIKTMLDDKYPLEDIEGALQSLERLGLTEEITPHFYKGAVPQYCPRCKKNSFVS